MKTKLGKFAMSKEVLANLVGFPDNHQIVNLYPGIGDDGGEIVWVTITGPQMPEVSQGARIPVIRPLIHKRDDLSMEFETVDK